MERLVVQKLILRRYRLEKQFESTLRQLGSLSQWPLSVEATYALTIYYEFMDYLGLSEDSAVAMLPDDLKEQIPIGLQILRGLAPESLALMSNFRLLQSFESVSRDHFDIQEEGGVILIFVSTNIAEQLSGLSDKQLTALVRSGKLISARGKGKRHYFALSELQAYNPKIGRPRKLIES